MPDMGPMPQHPQTVGSMAAALPTWVRAFWAVALGGVAVMHLLHARVVAGQIRWWHGVHMLMAVGMLAMYAADPMRQRTLDVVLLVVFAAVAVVVVYAGLQAGAAHPRWVASVLGLAAMIYMSAVMLWSDAIPHLLTWIVFGLLGADVLAWLTGGWDRSLVPRRAAAGMVAARRGDVRIGLAVMSAGVAYMLMAMV